MRIYCILKRSIVKPKFEGGYGSGSNPKRSLKTEEKTHNKPETKLFKTIFSFANFFYKSRLKKELPVHYAVYGVT